jgi:hypothetical protein
MDYRVSVLVFATTVVAWLIPLTTAIANTAPRISGTPAMNVKAGERYSFRPTVFDRDGQRLRFSIANKPAWAVFDPATGRLYGTPKAAYADETFRGISISVSDGVTRSHLARFSIAVRPVNRPPVLSGKPLPFVPVGRSYRFHPTARDPDSRHLRFSIKHRPAWASFDRKSGLLTGSPADSLRGRLYRDIRICVSDRQSRSCLPAFSIRVTASNRPPRISGTPGRTAHVRSRYSFTPRAFDPDGNAVRFVIENKPAWATFDPRTGRLRGMPQTRHAGRTTRNIRIAVTDGYAKSWLPAYTLTVGDVMGETGSATLSWAAPTHNTDGTRLSNLGGFVIEYGTRSDHLNVRLDIPDADLTSAVIEDLSPATWYFGVRAVSTAGVESELSDVVSTTIP